MTTKREIIDKIKYLVKSKYGEDFKKAFDAEDKNGDGKINYDELEQVLSQANIGFKLTRWAIAGEIMIALDPDSDGLISWNEFQLVLK